MDLFMLSAKLAPNKTIILNLSLKNKLTLKSKTIKVLFDTGATNSGICKSILLDCGYRDFVKGSSVKQTALEDRVFDTCKVEDFKLGNFQPKDFIVDVLPKDYKGFQGVLGMDYISNLETWISSSRRELFITGQFRTFANHVLDLTKSFKDSN